MWRMLLSRATDLEVTLDEARPTTRAGAPMDRALHLHTTGRPVVNRVAAMFAFRDGLIVRHYDSFSVLALGLPGARARWARCSAGSRRSSGRCARTRRRACEKFRVPRTQPG